MLQTRRPWPSQWLELRPPECVVLTRPSTMVAAQCYLLQYAVVPPGPVTDERDARKMFARCDLSLVCVSTAVLMQPI